MSEQERYIGNGVTLWYHCPKCNEPVDPIPCEIEMGKVGERTLICRESPGLCPLCGHEVKIRW